MVAAPTTTFDLTLENGQAIPIEQRPGNEVTSLNGQPVAPQGCEAINPAFDRSQFAFVLARAGQGAGVRIQAH